MWSGGPKRWTGIAAVGLMALAALPGAARADTTVYTFGRDQAAQLGVPLNPSSPDQGSVTPIAVDLPGATGPAAQAAVGGDFSLVLTTTGQIYSFGSNFYGQTGVTQGLGDPGGTAPQVVSVPGAQGRVIEVAAGGETSYALTSTGQVFAWGSNQYGQLGTSYHDGTEYSYAQPTPQLVSFPGENGPVVQIAAAGAAALALTSSGQVFAWGVNDNGAVGTSTNLGTENPNPTPTDVAFPSGSAMITRIAAAPAEPLALTSTGQLYAWGDYPGESDGSGANPTPTAVTLPGATGGVAAVAGGGLFTLVLTGSGQLYGYGSNVAGQLGTMNGFGGVGQSAPAQIPLGALQGEVASISAGAETSEVVTRSGQVDTFGDNEYGELGRDASSNDDVTPGPVSLPVAAAGLAVGGEAQFAIVIPATSTSSTPVAPTPPVTTPHRRGTVVVGRLRSAGARVAVPLRCRGGACAVTLTIAVRTRSQRRAHRTVVARRHVRLNEGRRRTVWLSLNRRGRRLLADHRRLVASVQVRPGPTRHMVLATRHVLDRPRRQA